MAGYLNAHLISFEKINKMAMKKRYILKQTVYIIIISYIFLAVKS